MVVNLEKHRLGRGSESLLDPSEVEGRRDWGDEDGEAQEDGRFSRSQGR